jgi:hypothetical protein
MPKHFVQIDNTLVRGLIRTRRDCPRQKQTRINDESFAARIILHPFGCVSHFFFNQFPDLIFEVPEINSSI